MNQLAVIAERVNTGVDAPETSRALVVFNLTDLPVSGVAVFRAAMSWFLDLPLPPVTVMDEGRAVPAAIHEMTEGPDIKGRADRRQLTFSLCFAVSDVPAKGWRTYIAAYMDAPASTLGDFVETPGLTVVETTRHGGDLPPVGSF